MENKLMIVFECIKSVIENENKKYVIDEESLRIANESHLLPFLYLSMDENTSIDIKEQIQSKFNAYILYDSMLDMEYNKFIKLMNDNGIKYSILKGFHLRKYYPKSFLRYMCDIDVLVDKKVFSKAGKILIDLGYSKGEFTNHDQGYIKNPFNIELHYKMISQKEYGGSYFKNPFSLMKKKDNSNEYIFKRKEDEYLYYFCHLLKHYEEYGIGFRNFIDLYLFLKNNDLDYEYIHKIYKMTSFYDDCIYLEEYIKDLFTEKEEYKEFTNKLLHDKTYGSMHQMMERELEHDSTIKWFFKKVFPNIAYMKNRYSILRHKMGYILLPFLYIHHWFYYGVVKLKYSIKKYKFAKSVKKEE